jgi:hypothetical protein
MSLQTLGFDCLSIYKFGAPFRDGGIIASLKYSQSLSGFRITSYGFLAPYNIYLEDGTRFSGRHVGWFSQKGAYAVYNYLDTVLNGNYYDMSSTLKIVAIKSENTPALQTRLRMSMGVE